MFLQGKDEELQPPNCRHYCNKKKFTRTFRWRSCGFIWAALWLKRNFHNYVLPDKTLASDVQSQSRSASDAEAREAEHGDWAVTFWFDSRPGDLKAAVSRRKTAENEAASVPSEQRTRSHKFVYSQLITLRCLQNQSLLCKKSVALFDKAQERVLVVQEVKVFFLGYLFKNLTLNHLLLHRVEIQKQDKNSSYVTLSL